MVHRAMKFTPEVLLSAPRRTAGVPNSVGSKVLYTFSTYSFSSHEKETELRVLDAASGESTRLADNDDIADLNWLDNDEFVCLQAEKDGRTSVYWGSVSECGKGVEVGRSHYVVGSIDASASNLKVVKLDDEGNEFGIVVSAQASPDGSLNTIEKSKKTVHSTGRLYDSLYVRHWDTWLTKERNALWYGKLSKSGKGGRWTMSPLTNALKDTGLESPIPPFGGTDNFDIFAGGIVFVAKDPQLNPALNTKSNAYVSKIKDWSGKGVNENSLYGIKLPLDYEGACTSPACSPDGKVFAVLAMKKNGYEADQNHIFVVPNLDKPGLEATRVVPGHNADVDKEWDRSPGSVCFSADSKSMLVTAEEYGTNKLFSLSVDPASNETPIAMTSTGSVSDVRPLPTALPAGQIFISGSSLVDNSWYAILNPHTLQKSDLEPLPSIIHSNASMGSKFNLHASQVTSIWTPSSNPSINKEVHSLVMKPSHFSPDKTYPVAYLIHGGPQGAWGDSWSTRWNPAVFAEQGYIVVAPNPTGSTGYGQAFCDAIRDNWGGDPYQDIVNVFEWVGENLTGADNGRAVALGASYGGYMVNWIQGQELGRKFKALVCHDGILSTAGMLATEELYFPFHDMGGTAWYDPGFKSAPSSTGGSSSAVSRVSTQAKNNFSSKTLADWRKWSPDEHLSNWSTPQLVIHSEKDYRIAMADGLAAFNVLQARGVESQFLTFPDENHWVLKPENSLVWHKVVLNWINKYVGLPPFTKQEPDVEDFWGGVRQKGEEVVEMEGQGRVET